MIYEIPYSKLAAIYDQIMDHVEYGKWAKYVDDLLRRKIPSIKSVIDLACGTGSFVSQFVQDNIPAYGMDISPEMLTVAVAKNQEANTRFLTGSLTEIPLKSKRFDVACILYDSINYLLTDDELNQAFSEVSRILYRNGILVFDTITKRHCTEHRADFNDSVYWDEYGYERRSHFNSEKNLQITDFQIVIGNQTFYEQHIQRIYEIAQLEEGLKSCGFEWTIFDGFSTQPATIESKRVHFLCSLKELES